MNILFIGDVVGKSGRKSVCDLLSRINNSKYKMDLVICNAENSAHGKGITSKIYQELLDYGVDVITMGNHTYSKKEIYEFIDDADKLVVPYNIKDRKGEGYRFFNVKGKKVCVINMLGKDLMGDYMNNPYEAMKELLPKIKDTDIKILDFHAESTAEKRIFFEIFKNDLDAFIGTHTHIPSADEDIIDGCAYITDVGMCGSYKSIIGRDIDESINMYITGEKSRYTVAESDPIVNACVLHFDEDNNFKIKAIRRVQIRP